MTLRGLADTSLRVVDITSPDRPVELTPVFGGGAGAITAAIGVSGRGTATLYAFTAPQTIPAEDVDADQPSALDARSNSADLVVIAHPSMLAAVEHTERAKRNPANSQNANEE